MRRPGQYGGPGGNAYVSGQMQHISGQRIEQKSNSYQGRPDSMTSEKEHPYGTSRADGQWGWERDGSSHIFNEGQGGDAPRSYYQGQRSDRRMALQKQGNSDPRCQPHEEDMDIGYEDKPMLQNFEGLEQRFLDDIMKLAKEQTDAEDAENARHRESINTINSQYQEQLGALRARHANRRDEFLKRESQARQQQYQQTLTDHYPNSGMGHSDPHGYPSTLTPAEEQHRGYSTEQYESYRERAQLLRGNRDHGFEPRGQYHGSRVHDTSSRYH